MNVRVLLNLLNELEKRDNMLVSSIAEHFIAFSEIPIELLFYPGKTFCGAHNHWKCLPKMLPMIMHNFCS